MRLDSQDPQHTPLFRMNLPGTRNTSACSFFLQLICLPNISCLRRELLYHHTSLSNPVHRPARLPRSFFLLVIHPSRHPPTRRHLPLSRTRPPQSLNNGIRVFDLRFAYNPGNIIGFYYCTPLSLSLPRHDLE